MRMFDKRVKICECCGYIVVFKVIFSIKSDHESISRFVNILFKLFFSMKGGNRDVWEYG